MGAIAVLCVVFGAVLVMGQAVVIRHRAGGAADLAALAAADHWMDGSAGACAQADRVARAQDTRVVRCALGGDVSDVTVAAGRGPLTAEVRSRAGPATAPGAAPEAAGAMPPAGTGTPGPPPRRPGPTKTKAHAGTKAPAKANTETGTDTETDTKTDTETRADTAAGTDAKAGTEAGPDAKAGTAAEREPRPWRTPATVL